MARHQCSGPHKNPVSPQNRCGHHRATADRTNPAPGLRQGGYIIPGWPLSRMNVVPEGYTQNIQNLEYPRWVCDVEGIQIGPLRLPVGTFGQVSTTR